VLYGLSALTVYTRRHNTILGTQNWFILEVTRVSSTCELEDILLQWESLTSCSRDSVCVFVSCPALSHRRGSWSKFLSVSL